MNFNEYLKLVLESRLKKNKGDRVKTAYELNMTLKSVTKYIEQFNLEKKRKTNQKSKAE